MAAPALSPSPSLSQTDGGAASSLIRVGTPSGTSDGDSSEETLAVGPWTWGGGVFLLASPCLAGAAMRAQPAPSPGGELLRCSPFYYVQLFNCYRIPDQRDQPQVEGFCNQINGLNLRLKEREHQQLVAELKGYNKFRFYLLKTKTIVKAFSLCSRKKILHKRLCQLRWVLIS